jgi:hypothetical protein
VLYIASSQQSAAAAANPKNCKKSGKAANWN